MADNTQPTILVKKADGTTERVSLADLKKRTAKPVVTNEPVISPSPAPAKPVMPEKKIEPAEVKKPVLAKPTVKPVVLPHSFTAKDAVPLAEDPDISHPSLSKTVVPRQNDVDKVLAKFSFSVPADYVSRLRSVVLLAIKDIRSEADTRELVLRSIKEGGLGLTENQADELLSACQSISKLPMVAPKAIPAVVKPAGLPANTAPFNAFVSKDPSVTQPVAPKAVPKPMESERPAFSKSKTMTRPVMRDVIPARPAILDPVEEIAYMTLTDFRRLSSDPVTAAKKLSQKFINLKEESIILFLRSRDGWRRSPLYLDYVNLLAESLQAQTPVSALSGKENGITSSELSALAGMEKELGL